VSWSCNSIQLISPVARIGLNVANVFLLSLCFLLGLCNHGQHYSAANDQSLRVKSCISVSAAIIDSNFFHPLLFFLSFSSCSCSCSSLLLDLCRCLLAVIINAIFPDSGVGTSDAFQSCFFLHCSLSCSGCGYWYVGDNSKFSLYVDYFL